MKKIQKNEGFTLIELLIVVAIIGIIAAIAVPGLLRARQSGNEASAIGTVRAVNSAQATYAASCGGGGYASTLLALATAPANGVPFISPDIAVGGVGAPKSGYAHALAAAPAVSLTGAVRSTVVMAAANTCNAAVTPTLAGYTVNNDPVTRGSTGQRSFASDERGTIFQDPLVTIPDPIPAAQLILQ